MKEKSCGAVVFKSHLGQKYYLLVQMNHGHWSFPKGHVEPNETEEMTAIREIKEETGLEVRINTEFRQVITYSPKVNVEKDVIYFLASPITEQITKQIEEIQEIQWFSYDQAFAQLTYANDKHILFLANDFLELNEVNQ